MSAKILSSLSDENRTNLRKQIGCINGVFQIFDRQRLLSTRTRIEKNEKRRVSVEEEKRPSTAPPDLRDVVKGSMNREARSIKAAKHVDSPRPLRHHNDDDQQMKHARFSYDGRATTKNASSTSTRLKGQLPRLSLDSRASSDRSDLLDRFRVGYVSCNVEPGIHRRSSSVIVAKLMGLESFPEPNSTTDEHRTSKSISNAKEALASSRSSSKPDARRLQNASQSPAASPSPRSMQSIKAATTRSSSSPRVSAASSSYSVYGEIEKRVAQLEFKKSCKDLRALKQILEAMQRTRERLENQREQFAEVSSSSARRRRSNSEDDRTKFTSPTNVVSMDVMHVQRLQNLSTKPNHKEDATSRRKVRAFEPQETNGHLPSINKMGVVTRNNMEHDRIVKAPRGSKVKSCTKLQQNLFHGEESSKITKHSSKKLAERNSKEDKKYRSTPKTSRLSDEISSAVTCSSYQQGVEQQKYVKTRKERTYHVQLEDTSIEQPSPVSVLDAAFYSEDPLSPVRKITLASQEDEDANSDDIEYPISETSVNCVHKIRLSNRDQRAASSNHNESSVSACPSNSNFSRHLISSEMFHALKMKAAKDVKSNDINDRKIISDVINEILYRKIASGGFYAVDSEKRPSPRDLMKEVYLELNSVSTIQNCDFGDDDDDGTLKLINLDMKYDSEDWTTYQHEVPALVLDTERLIFKDLINEVLTNTAF